jgi:Cyclopropane fatty acid synthase and related methyltransferases
MSSPQPEPPPTPEAALPERRGPVAAPAAAPSRARRVFLDALSEHLAGARIVFRTEDGRHEVGRGEDVTAVVRVHRERFFERALAQGNLGLGEAFMDGDWEVEQGTLEGLLEALLRARLDKKLAGNPGVALKVLALQLLNGLRGRQWAHVQRHYDVGDDLFELFLDRSLVYSCAYLVKEDDSIETMQVQKLDRICRKLDLRPGERLLDIGCGFGGLLIHAASRFGVAGVGITTSARHAAKGMDRVRAAGLDGRVTLELRDHRTVEGRFDKVVSVGMMEHLPRGEYARYFERIAAVLAPEGRGLVHTIGCNAARNRHDPFIQKYVFPGSGQPKLSEMAAECERHGLAILDVENMVRHYAHTARRWLDRFRERAHLLDPKRYDASFRRMWEYYLCCCIAGARASDGALYQVLFARDYAAEMPLHRV